MKYNNHDKIRDFIIIEAYMFRFKKKVKPEVDMTIKAVSYTHLTLPTTSRV
ncbi:hypothetical protein JMUB7520_27690 [Staphylococcus aureus]